MDQQPEAGLHWYYMAATPVRTAATPIPSGPVLAATVATTLPSVCGKYIHDSHVFWLMTF